MEVSFWHLQSEIGVGKECGRKSGVRPDSVAHKPRQRAQASHVRLFGALSRSASPSLLTRSSQLAADTEQGGKTANQDKLDLEIIKLSQLRQSRITIWIRKYGLRKAQYMAGFRRVLSIERYRDPNLEDLKEQVKKYHPFK